MEGEGGSGQLSSDLHPGVQTGFLKTHPQSIFSQMFTECFTLSSELFSALGMGQGHHHEQKLSWESVGSGKGQQDRGRGKKGGKVKRGEGGGKGRGEGKKREGEGVNDKMSRCSGRELRKDTPFHCSFRPFFAVCAWVWNSCTEVFNRTEKVCRHYLRPVQGMELQPQRS